MLQQLRQHLLHLGDMLFDARQSSIDLLHLLIDTRAIVLHLLLDLGQSHCQLVVGLDQVAIDLLDLLVGMSLYLIEVVVDSNQSSNKTTLYAHTASQSHWCALVGKVCS
jgi:hypothetical protein